MYFYFIILDNSSCCRFFIMLDALYGGNVYSLFVECFRLSGKVKNHYLIIIKIISSFFRNKKKITKF